MDANFNAMIPLKPFRFWCQKVLPLVYDDSLSYFELLCKVVDYLNNTMTDVNTLGENFNQLVVLYNQLSEYVRDYFASLDAQEMINNKLDEMATNGELDSLISPVVTEWLQANVIPFGATVIVDKTLSISNAAADSQNTGIAVETERTRAINEEDKKINFPIREDGTVDFGNNGQILRSKSGGQTEWIDPATPTQEQINTSVNAWLDDNPSATTTVEDDSLTEVKFTDELKKKTIKDYVTPEMFGAVGSGDLDDDDTDAVRAALKYSIDNGKKLLLPNTYYITRSLLTDTDYTTAKINIEGCKPCFDSSNEPDEYGGIKFANGTNLFDGLTITGSIMRVTLAPVSQTKFGSIFNNCELRAFIMQYCTITNILSFANDTRFYALTRIMDNNIKYVVYFAKATNSRIACLDSYIERNYIHGVSDEQSHCFEFYDMTASYVTANYIDYFRTIFCPYSATSANFVPPASVNNNYNVFRYFYSRSENFNSIRISSSNDTFGMMDPDLIDVTQYPDLVRTKEIMDSWANNPDIFTKDGVDYIIPPCIMIINTTDDINILNANIGTRCKNLVFVETELTSRKFGSAILTIASTATALQGFPNPETPYDSNMMFDTRVTIAGLISHSGGYKWNMINIPFIKIFDSEPQPGANATPDGYFVGEYGYWNFKIYRYCVVPFGVSGNRPNWVDVTASITF